jgi:hypothetical protein
MANRGILISGIRQLIHKFLGICKGMYLPIIIGDCVYIRAYLGVMEYGLVKYFKKYVSKGACCYDIGAAEGYYLCSFHRLSGGGRVYIFEPDLNWGSVISKILVLNNIKNAVYIPRFVGNITSSENNSVTIDYLVFQEKAMPPDVIKVDIDGGEYEFLCGAEKTILTFHPKLIIETHSKEIDEKCQQFLKKCGYLVTIINQPKFFKEFRPCPLNRWIAAEFCP